MSKLEQRITDLHAMLFGPALDKHRKTKRIVYVLRREGAWTIQGRKRAQESERYYMWQDGHFMMVVPNLSEELLDGTRGQASGGDKATQSKSPFGRSA